MKTRIWHLFLLALLSFNAMSALILLLVWLFAPDKFTGRDFADFLVCGVSVAVILYLMRSTDHESQELH